MRGLTSGEFELLDSCLKPCEPSRNWFIATGDNRIVRRLETRGLLGESTPCHCGDYHLKLTTTGLLALAIHRAISAGMGRGR